jgi:hypothetical protein
MGFFYAGCKIKPYSQSLENSINAVRVQEVLMLWCDGAAQIIEEFVCHFKRI